MNTDLGADEEPARAPLRVSAEGVNVRKIASTRGEDAVVVDLTLRSGRNDTCRVRIEDAVPDPLQDNPVEFHPRYDPANWTHDADSVVYEAPIGPGVVRRTVYGVVVDDPSQLDLFMTPPAVEITEVSASATEGPTGDGSFEFGVADGSETSADGHRSPSIRERSPTGTARTVRDSVVDSLVSELRHRELTRAERDALREALDLESIPAELEALADTVEGLVDRTDGLSAELDDLEATVGREVRWRAELRQFLVADPDGG